ncbi:hypothetical protein DdX_19250 [Ditylenchus destructor]|uniref:Uncharacterized protein n=1 Tax=Ditylenchus destructor TaxID=166010 RepID=A0AAD4MIT1_9BILA|nr:hypothetical protein DdX_19250 [Ditylenchus destructor]
MDSTPNQPQPSSSGRNVQKANEKRIAKREKQEEKLAKLVARNQAKQTRRRQQGGTANLQAVVQARPQLRRQESALDLVPCFNPLYPQEEVSYDELMTRSTKPMEKSGGRSSPSSRQSRWHFRCSTTS